MDSPVAQEEDPQRMSALYQYHNAPEVLPAHGLEYDDTIYPSSDKYPVVRERAFDYGKHGYRAGDDRPPRIIFGMKLRTFLIVAFIMVLVVVGAIIGGVVGGKSLRNSDTLDGTTTGTGISPSYPMSSSTPSSTQPDPTHSSVPTPTYVPLSDCPGSNDTRYNSTYLQGTSGTVPAGAGLVFTKFCNKSSPLSARPNATRIAEAFMYSFNDCIDLCASFNFWSAARGCSIAVYEPAGRRPGNCWVGNPGDRVTAASLQESQGVEVAILVPRP